MYPYMYVVCNHPPFGLSLNYVPLCFIQSPTICFFIYLFEYINHNAKNKCIPQFVHVHEFQINWATGSYIYRFFPSIRPPEF